jgi:dTDP-4-dehydrorhamnose reductase
MKILLMGSYGMLGHKLIQRLKIDHDLYGTCKEIRRGAPWYSILDDGRLIAGVQAEKIETVARALIKSKPDVVINCVGIVKQSQAAADPIASITVNSLFPHLLARECSSHDARLIHFSTDCVFSGKKGMYSVNDSADPEDLYGRTKLLGEVGGKASLTIRSSLIGRELGTRNGLLEWFLAQRGKSVKGYKNAIFSGFTTLEMSNVISMILKEHENLTGIWHIASNPISKYDLLSLINREMDLGIQIEPEDSVVCDRSLDGSAFSSLTGYRPPSWNDMIKEMVKDSYP